jgi:response regulator RpfG family c-di-GMP phosphodiesterase
VNAKVLIVDDSLELLASMRRQLRNDFELEVADGAEAGLRTISEQGPFAVVVSDMQMPQVNGVEFLARVEQSAPDTVRVMLTGNVDQATAAKAVNEGHVFRFVNKPCNPDDLRKVIRASIEQHRMITAEKELLSKTVTGSVKVLIDILTLANPDAFSRTWRIRRMSRHLASRLRIDTAWEIELAAMLSKIGYVTLDDVLVQKLQSKQAMTEAEKARVRQLPETAGNLIKNVPRLEGVANIVRYQDKCFDGTGFPDDVIRGEAIPIGARVLKLTHDFDDLLADGSCEPDAVANIVGAAGKYDPRMVAEFQHCLAEDTHRTVRSIPIGQLKEGDVLAEHLEDYLGYILVSRGHEITRTMLDRVKSSAQNRRIREPIRVVDWME